MTIMPAFQLIIIYINVVSNVISRRYHYLCYRHAFDKFYIKGFMVLWFKIHFPSTTYVYSLLFTKHKIMTTQFNHLCMLGLDPITSKSSPNLIS